MGNDDPPQAEADLYAWLDARIGWMRNRGVRRLRTADVEIELDPDHTPTPEAAARRELSEEEQKAKKREKKRQRYLGELGYTPSDELLDRLP